LVLLHASYLVNGILTCGNCHTPRGPGSVWDMSKQLSAGPRTWDEVTFKAKPANIQRDGAKLKPPMAFSLYATMTDQDLSAIVAYLRTVPPKE
jgi:mono/diheme cytochrome c family protein